MNEIKNSGKGRIAIAVLLLGARLGLCACAADNSSGGPAPNLGDLSIEQLMNESVTSVSKKATGVFQSPAAVAVVTADDIDRMGFTSIPDALSYVPGLDVARINGSDWAISSRGSNSEFANDLLVLIDGRTIYAPSFGGVNWEAQQMPMQDVDRIEVIRGPGSILWGANAENGVINVISKDAKETQGLLASASEGSEADPSLFLRYGGQAGNSVYYRADVSYFNENGLVDASGKAAPDFSHGWHLGFRVDAAPSTEDKVTLEGEYYDLKTGEAVAVPQLTAPFVPVLDVVSGDQGANLLGKWVRGSSDAKQWSAQVYYSHFHNAVGVTQELDDTFDFDFQDRFPIGSSQDIVAGFGYRYERGVFPPSAVATWTPELDLIHLYSAFIQDQIALVPDRLSLIPGTKFEHNDVTGFEVEPGIRLLWTPAPTQTAWLGVTRAVRTPALTETAAQFAVSAFPTSPGGPPAEVVLAGNPDLVRAEQVVAYEAGYRIQPSPNLSLDFATFYNVYDDLIGYGSAESEFVATPLPPHLVLISTSQTGGTGRSLGAETSVQLRLTSNWRLAADYSFIHMQFLPDDSEALDSPQHQAHLRSYLDLPHHLELNGGLSYISGIVDTEGAAPVAIPSYVRIDLGIVWRPSPSLELGIWGRGLGDSRHPEFGSQLTPLVTEVPREITTRITWRH